MVKNTKGGKGAKGLARKSQMQNNHVTQTRYAQDVLEKYACVTKMFGNGMCEITLDDSSKLIGHIRSKFRGRQKRHNMINMFSMVLIGLREWESLPKNCDILCIYDDNNINQLKENPQIEIKNLLGLVRGSLNSVERTDTGTDNFIITEETDSVDEEEITDSTQTEFIVGDDDEEISFDDI